MAGREGKRGVGGERGEGGKGLGEVEREVGREGGKVSCKFSMSCGALPCGALHLQPQTP